MFVCFVSIVMIEFEIDDQFELERLENIVVIDEVLGMIMFGFM